MNKSFFSISVVVVSRIIPHVDGHENDVIAENGLAEAHVEGNGEQARPVRVGDHDPPSCGEEQPG